MPRLRSALLLAAATALLTSSLGAGPAQAAAAPLPVTSSTVSVSNAGRAFSAIVTQPTGSAPRAYPVVAFGHGFTQSASRYTSTLKAIAARGYVVVAPNSQTGLFPSHSAFADDLWAAVAWAARTQPNASASKDAVMGHSMGGGAALLAASRHPELDSVATLAAAQTTPSAVAAAGQLRMPALFVVGSSDTVVKPATTRAMFDAKPSPATWISVSGGYHCGFLDSSSFFGLGCDKGSISRATQLGISNTLLGVWLDATLKNGPAVVAPAGTVRESK